MKKIFYTLLCLFSITYQYVAKTASTTSLPRAVIEVADGEDAAGTEIYAARRDAA